MSGKYLHGVKVLSKIYQASFLLYEIKNNVLSQYDMENNLYYYGVLSI